MALIDFAAELTRIEGARLTGQFPRVPDHAPLMTELTAHATRDIESAVCDYIIAANEATSRAELRELREVVSALVLQLEAVVSVTKDLAVRRFGSQERTHAEY